MQTLTVDAHASFPPSFKPSQKKKRRPKPAQMQTEAPLITGDLLGIPGLETIAPPEVGDFSMLFKAKQLKPAACPYCDCATKQFHSNGSRSKTKQRLFDEPRGCRRVLIEISRRNFRCDRCAESGLLPLWGVRERQRLTERLVHYVKLMSLLRPFAEVALMTGLSERKVREIFDMRVKQLEKTVKFELPRVIGLDGIKIRKMGRFVVITDIERKLVLNVWNYSRESDKDDPQAATRALTAMLKKLDGAKQIEAVVIDMSRQFRSAVGEALPQAKIIIDRYHIQRTANEAMDNTRERLHAELKKQEKDAKMCHASMLRKRWSKLKPHQREYLEKWFIRHPALRTAYDLKEGFCRMWDSGSADEARQYYKVWSQRFLKIICENNEQAKVWKDFNVILGPMEEWSKYVYNYFDLARKQTNSFTEWSNGKIRDLRRESRGCSVDVMRAKLIFGTWVKQQLKKGSKKWGETMVMEDRTREPSSTAPKTDGDEKKSKLIQKPATPPWVLPGQLSLYEW